MTKTLTEQWRKGTLEYGYYYVKHTFGWKPFGITIDFWHGPFDKWGAIPNDYVKEVLSAVPSYDEWKRLLYKRADHLSQLAKKVERLKEQLKEANHILKDVFISDAYYKSKRAQYLKRWGVK